MDAGALDERVHIERRTATQDAELGVNTYSWDVLASVWADVRWLMGGERIADGVDLTSTPCMVSMRYRDDVTPQMRILIGDNAYRIVRGPIERGRRERIEMVCERLSTEGTEA